MRGSRTQRKGKVRHPRHDCGAALSGGSRSGVGVGQASGAARRFAVRRGSVGQASGARAVERTWCSRAMRGPRTQRKGKVRYPRHDCGAALSGGSQSGVDWGKRAARGRLSGRGAVGRCAGLVPNEKVKSVIRDTIAARRCQAARSQAWIGASERRSPVVRGQAWERGKRAAARAVERTWCSRAMHGPCPPRKGKVCHSRHDCGARGRVRGRGAVCRCAGLVPHERVKSVIRDTIAARRCRAMRGPCAPRKGKVRHP